MNDKDFFIKVYNSLLIRFNIIINTEYQFVYDNFFEHLIDDTNKLVDKNYKENKAVFGGHMTTKKEYKIEIFKRMFTDHSNSKQFHKLIHPESQPEIKRKLRLKKLKKLFK